ncbi:MAG TPA: hypothetical protein VKW76_05300 [Candidatus Binatia bacterium]|nr:hypothetical protein [Candidatus Binatia bacterium]
MSLPKHLEEAARRLEDASSRIEAARAKPPTPASLQDWLVALTEYCTALSDIQRLDNESIHEKLHAIAGRLGVERVL